MKRFALLTILCTLTAMLITPSIYAEKPKTIKYIGHLTSSEGDSVDGIVAVNIGLYNSPDAETPFWSRNIPDVLVSNGEYEVIVGRDDTFAKELEFPGDYYLKVEIEGTKISSSSQSLVNNGSIIGMRNAAPDGSGVIIQGEDCGVYAEATGGGGCFTRGVMGVSDVNAGVGVYGTSSAGSGRGVVGETTGSESTAVTGRAYSNWSNGAYFYVSGTDSRGVYAFAGNTTDTKNYGGHFTAQGIQGRGVYGEAKATTGINYGGEFLSKGVSGRGVYGLADNTTGTNYGGYFDARGTSGRGVYAFTNGSNGRSVYAQATGNSGIAVYGSGTLWDFYAVDGNGSTGYGPFTGGHEVKIGKGQSSKMKTGLIVSLTGKTTVRQEFEGQTNISSTLPTVALSQKAMDKAVFGVFVRESPLPEGHWYGANKDECFGVVNALGEGRVWVSDCNGPIEVGDYITTSAIQGFGQLQKDDTLHSYTLGKAMENVDWGSISQTVESGGSHHKVYLIAVIYTSG